ncbi:unnamed protein product [Cochlearia groenlandica]
MKLGLDVNETKALPGRVPSIKAKPKSKLKATLLWNLNLASATILVGTRASSLLGVSFTGHPRCSVFPASGKQYYRAFPAPDVNETKALPGRVPSIKARPKSKLKFG